MDVPRRATSRINLASRCAFGCCIIKIFVFCFASPVSQSPSELSLETDGFAFDYLLVTQTDKCWDSCVLNAAPPTIFRALTSALSTCTATFRDITSNELFRLDIY